MKKTLLISAITFIALFGLQSCEEDVWNEQTRKEFVTDCVKGMKAEYPNIVAGEYCSCMQKKMESKYSLLEVVFMTEGELNGAMLEIEKPCLKYKKKKE